LQNTILHNKRTLLLRASSAVPSAGAGIEYVQSNYPKCKFGQNQNQVFSNSRVYPSTGPICGRDNSAGQFLPGGAAPSSRCGSRSLSSSSNAGHKASQGPGSVCPTRNLIITALQLLPPTHGSQSADDSQGKGERRDGKLQSPLSHGDGLWAEPGGHGSVFKIGDVSKCGSATILKPVARTAVTCPRLLSLIGPITAYVEIEPDPSVLRTSRLMLTPCTYISVSLLLAFNSDFWEFDVFILFRRHNHFLQLTSISLFNETWFTVIWYCTNDLMNSSIMWATSTVRS